MYNGRIASALLTIMVFAVSVLQAQQKGTVPALSGVWDTGYSLGRNDICGEPNCRAVGDLPVPPPNRPIVEPQMTPWAEAKVKAAREAAGVSTGDLSLDDSPWFSSCLPMGPAMLMAVPFIATELQQFPDLVLLFFTGTAGEGDHSVRRIYLDGRGHPANLKPTPMGHSIGHYDGDTLVVDTVGISDSWLDLQAHPHSEALHLVERFRRVGERNLEYEITVQDPTAYKNTWSRKIVRELSPPGPRYWDATNCEELLRMGTHFSAEAQK